MIEVNHLTKTFRKQIRKKGVWGMFISLFSKKYEEKTAVDHISFTIQDGEAVAYIGANGAGKSTTIKMMTGILTPTSGSVTINGLHPYISKERKEVLKNIGVVFGQRTQLWWDLPLEDTYELLKQVYEIPEQDYQERFSYLCDILGLKPFLNSPVRSLSLGQRMRADIAASLLHNPKILFLDEPTIGLDILVKHKIIEALKLFQKQYNTTIILTTHDLGDIEGLCKRIIIIDEGHILYDGDIDQIKHKFGDIRTIELITKSEINEIEIKEELTGILQITKKEQGYTLQVDASKTSIHVLLSYLFTRYEILDIKMSEISIESVVEHIYETKEIS